MNNWGQQPPGHGQAYNGHGYQQMPPQPGYAQQQQHQQQHQQRLQQQQAHQQQFHQQQQHQQHTQHQQPQYGTGNSMSYMGNQQYQTGANFLPAPAQHPHMQAMPQYAHAQVHHQAPQAQAHAMNNFHAQQQQQQQQQHQHQQRRQSLQQQQQQQQPFSNGTFQHHAQVSQLQAQQQSQPQLQPQSQYLSHHNYAPQVVTPSPRPIQRRIPSQQAQPLQQPLQPQQQPIHQSHQLIPQKRRSVQQLQSPRTNSPHVPSVQLQQTQQLQSPRVSSPHVQPGQRQAAAQPYQSPRVTSPHIQPSQLQTAQPYHSQRVNSPHIQPSQLQAVQPIQSSRVNSPHIQPSQLQAVQPTQSPRVNSPHIQPSQLQAAPSYRSPRLHSPHIQPSQLQTAPQHQSPSVNSPYIQPSQLQAPRPSQSPRVGGAHLPAAKPPLPQQLQSPRVTTSNIPSPQLQPAPKSQSPRVSNPQAPKVHPQPTPSAQTPLKVESPVPSPAQMQPAMQPQLPQERKQPAPAIQPPPQRHVSDGIDPTQLMLKREPPAPARKSLPAPVAKSPSISSKSPSMPSAQTPTSHFDTPAVLICVADDCFQTAHAAVQDIATSLDRQRVDEYYKVVATGLGCLDAALNLNKLQPRPEANIRLRYATALSEETDNLMEAETALTKGIAICEKNRYTDLKYCMQFQLLKVLFRRNRKAAFVEVDKNIQDAATYKAVDWVYAFKFLKASLHLHSGNPADAQALDNLRSITKLASNRGDLAIAVISSLLEGIVHLKARKEDSIVRVQTCIAQASRYQLDPSVQIPQVEVLTLLLDLACTLQQKAPQVAMQKLKALQARMDELVQAHGWDKMLDVLHLPLKKQPNSSAWVTNDTKTIIYPGDGEHNFIVLSFVTKVHAFVLAYVLSGLALLYQGAKSEKVMEYWSEALNMLGKTPPHARPPAHSLPMAIEQARWQAEVKRYVYALIALMSATRSQWNRVHDCIQKIEALSPKPERGRLDLLVLYVTGVYHQGTGDVAKALEIYSDQRFAIPVAATDDSKPRAPPPEVALLAAMNKIWIMQDSSHRNDEELIELIERMTPYCSDHADVDIRTAFNLMQAALETEPRQSMRTVKNHIQVGLKWAQGANNTQLLAVALNLMRSVLFENVVGDQAVKSAKAGRQQAHKAGNLLWMSVADGMLAQTVEMQGQVDEAELLRHDGTRFANQAFTRPDSD